MNLARVLILINVQYKKQKTKIVILCFNVLKNNKNKNRAEKN